MRVILKLLGLVCLGSAPVLTGQNALLPSGAVSLYELSHKPTKQARELSRRGEFELKRGRYESGARFLEKAVDLDPKYWMAQNNLGYSYLKLTRRDKAQAAFERAVAIDPENAVGYVNLSLVALERNNYEIAEMSARTAMRLDPRLLEAKALVSLSQIGKGLWSEEARLLLKESCQTIHGADLVLKKWPRPQESGPRVVLNASAP